MDSISALRAYVTHSPMRVTVLAPPRKPSITTTPTLETVASSSITDVPEMTIDLTLWRGVDVSVKKVGTQQPTVEPLQVGQNCLVTRGRFGWRPKPEVQYDSGQVIT